MDATGNDSGTVARRSLGRQLKALRLAAGKTPADFRTAEIGSASKLSRIENGKTPVRVLDVREMCRIYQVDPVTTDQLVLLAINTSAEGWWEDYSDVMPSWFGLYVELEAAAARVESFDPELVYGLLQTPAYHRAVFDSGMNGTDDAAAKRQIALRGQRQQAAFDREAPLQVTTVIGAAALARMVGGPEVMAEQHDRLIELCQTTHVDVYVLPWSMGAHPAMRGAFTVLGFDDPKDPDVVYLETYAGGRYVEQETLVSQYRTMFETVRTRSVPLEEYTP